jgi:hypothetical protein
MKKEMMLAVLAVASIGFCGSMTEKEVYSDEGIKLLIRREVPKPVIVEKEVIKEVYNPEREDILRAELSRVKKEKADVLDNYDTLKIHTDEAKRIVDSKSSGRQWWDNPIVGFIAGLIIGNFR